MARKKEILTESEIRRFMKLASMAPVGDSRLQEMYGDPVLEVEDEEPMDMSPDMSMDELPGDPEMEMDVEVDPEMDMEVEASPVDEEVAAELAQGIADVMRDVLGVEVSVEGGEEEMPEMEPEMEPEMDLEPEEEAPMGGDAPGALEDEEPGSRPGNTTMSPVYENEDALVNEVAKRVAARLAKENKKAKTIDDLTERIFARLTKK